MKKMIAILAALVMLFGAVALAEGTPAFTLNMTEAEVRAKLPGVRIEKEQKAKLTYLDPDDYDYIANGLKADIEFALKDDKVVLIEVKFDHEDGATPDAVLAMLKQLYGEGQALTDLEKVNALAAVTDADEVELFDDEPLTYTFWDLETGSRVLMVTETKDQDCKVYYYSAELA